MGEFRRLSGRQASRTEPEFSIYKNGDARLNQPAVEQYLDGVETIAFYADSDGNRLGISRGDRGPFAKEIETGKHGGFQFYAGRILREFDIDVEELTESVAIPIENDLDEGLLVIDLDPVWEVNDVE